MRTFALENKLWFSIKFKMYFFALGGSLTLKNRYIFLFFTRPPIHLPILELDKDVLIFTPKSWRRSSRSTYEPSSTAFKSILSMMIRNSSIKFTIDHDPHRVECHCRPQPQSAGDQMISSFPLFMACVRIHRLHRLYPFPFLCPCPGLGPYPGLRRIPLCHSGPAPKACKPASTGRF
jgi:hypothetical protein